LPPPTPANTSGTAVPAKTSIPEYKEVSLGGSDTLSAKVNFDIEVDWDYAYLVVSTDGGATWANIETDKSTTTDPNGQNFGFGITGSSGDHVPGGRRRLAGKNDAVLRLHLQSGPDRCHHAALQQPAVRAPEPAFNDNLQYYNTETPTAGVINPHTGPEIVIRSVSTQDSFMQVQVRPAK
jgi:hypothetical protein